MFAENQLQAMDEFYEKLNKKWWCTVHKREATYLDVVHAHPVCDPKLGGILIPCNCVEIDK